MTPNASAASAKVASVGGSRRAVEQELLRALLSDEPPATIARAILRELLAVLDADAAAIWMTAHDAAGLELVASVAGAQAGPAHRTADVPPYLTNLTAAGTWCVTHGWTGTALAETPQQGGAGRHDGFVAVMRRRPDGRAARDARFLRLVRGELAIALRATQLRETLQSERAELAAILDGASDAIIAVDAVRRVVRVNRAASQLLGIPVPEPERHVACHELLGCRSSGTGAADGRTASKPERLLCGQTCPFGEVLAGSPAITQRELQVRDRSGALVPVSGSYARTPGARPGAVAILRDLRASRAVDELTGSFVAAVSHELRTPVALISGYVQTLLELDPDPATARRYVERIGRAAGRLGELVDQILDITRLEGDPLVLHRQPTAVTTLFGRLAQEAAESPGMPTLGMAAPPDLPRVDVDPGRIGEVLANLVSNAVKYAGPAGAQVTIRAEEAGAQILVRVEDEGPGIDPEDRAHVFERFYRGRHVRESSYPGSGLGLYVCRRLVEAHGGRIWLEERSPGTTICFTLPVATGEPDGAPVEADR